QGLRSCHSFRCDRSVFIKARSYAASGDAAVPRLYAENVKPLQLLSNGCFPPLIDRIDLGPLQFVGVIDINRFPLGIEVYSPQASLTMPIAGGFGAAERQMHFSANGRCVHVGNSGIDVAHSAESPVHIARIDGGGEAIGHAVGDVDGLLEALA